MVEKVYTPPVVGSGVSQKPPSVKKEFEQLLRDIRRIAASSRAQAGDLIAELTKETQSVAKKQRNWTCGGTAGQALLPLVLPAIALACGSTLEGLQLTFRIGSKIGDGFNTVVSGAHQMDYQARTQQLQQSLGHYNAFDQRMASLEQSINTMKQQLAQKEMEENR